MAVNELIDVGGYKTLCRNAFLRWELYKNAKISEKEGVAVLSWSRRESAVWSSSVAVCDCATDSCLIAITSYQSLYVPKLFLAMLAKSLGIQECLIDEANDVLDIVWAINIHMS